MKFIFNKAHFLEAQKYIQQLKDSLIPCNNQAHLLTGLARLKQWHQNG
jgi:hypothetical protein